MVIATNITMTDDENADGDNADAGDDDDTGHDVGRC